MPVALQQRRRLHLYLPHLRQRLRRRLLLLVRQAR